jgi:hypothetical protein
MHQAERRKSPRFPLRQPVLLKVAGSEPLLSGVSHNVSKEGLLFEAAAAPAVGARGEVVLSLESRLERNIRLSGHCTVLRVAPLEAGKYAIALGCAHPLSMVD